MESLLLPDESVADENKGKDHKTGKGDEKDVDSLRNHFLLYKRSSFAIYFGLWATSCGQVTVIAGAVIGALGMTTA